MAAPADGRGGVCRRARHAAATMILAFTAVALSTTPGRAQDQLVYQPVCEVITFSPDFERDRTAFCATAEYVPGTVQPSGNVIVRRTNDGAATWDVLPSVGLQGLGISWPNQILISPSYPDNDAIYVQVVFGARPGLYRSTDGGETFLPVAPLATAGRHTRPLTPFVGAAPIPPPLGAGTDAFAYASIDEARPALLTPPMHTPVTASPDGAAMFLLPPNSVSAGPLVVARGVYEPSADPSTWQHQLAVYRCNAAFTCAEMLAEFPPGLDLVDAAYLHDGTVYVVMETFGAGTDTQVWRSTDGETFEPWKSVNALAPHAAIDGNSDVVVDIADVPEARGRYFARVSYQASDQTTVAEDRVFRSDDGGGEKWRLVASSRPARRSKVGLIPWYRRIGPIYAKGELYVPSDDLMMVLAYDVELDDPAAEEYLGPFCSTDGGRTWSRGCR